MSGKLAVFTNQLHTASETFIRRHVEDLLPGKTVVVVRLSGDRRHGSVRGANPVLYLDRWALRLPVRLARRAGASETKMRDAKILRFLRQHDVTSVLGEYLDLSVDFVPLFDRIGLPYIVQGHGLDVSAALRRTGVAQSYMAYKSAKAILTRCEFHRRRLIALGLPEEIVHVSPGGIDVPDSPPARDARAGKRFLAVGRMVAKKGPIYLLEAFRRAAIEDREITLDYIGGGQLLPAARQFVLACGLDQRVRLHGAVDDETKMRLWSECGGFLQHSVTDPETGDEEGLPAAIQEAMANAMTVITTRHSGIPEAIEHGQTGLLSDEMDCREMAANIAMVSRGETSSRLGIAAWTKARKNYTWACERDRLLLHLGTKTIASGDPTK